MKGTELIQRMQRYAKVHGLACHVDQKRGKGSHVTLYLGERLTIVRNPKDVDAGVKSCNHALRV